MDWTISGGESVQLKSLYSTWLARNLFLLLIIQNMIIGRPSEAREQFINDDSIRITKLEKAAFSFEPEGSPEKRLENLELRFLARTCSLYPIETRISNIEKILFSEEKKTEPAKNDGWIETSDVEKIAESKKSLPLDVVMWKVYTDKADVSFKGKNFGETISFLEKAKSVVEIDNMPGNTRLMKTVSRLSELYLLVGEPEKYFDCLQVMNSMGWLPTSYKENVQDMQMQNLMGKVNHLKANGKTEEAQNILIGYLSDKNPRTLANSDLAYRIILVQYLARNYCEDKKFEQAAKAIKNELFNYESRLDTMMQKDREKTYAGLLFAQLAFVCAEENKLPESEALYDKSLAIINASLQPENRMAILTRIDKIDLLKKLGKVEEAEKEFDKLFELRKSSSMRNDQRKILKEEYVKFLREIGKESKAARVEST